jgi:hypothetical protein
MSCCNNHGMGNDSSGSQNTSLARHISRFIGETVTIFTTSGGASGCGFTGVVLAVNNCFVRLVTDQGMAPSNPLAENICGEMDNDNGPGVRGGNFNLGRGNCHEKKQSREVGSVCDIPIDRIAAFCHNAV